MNNNFQEQENTLTNKPSSSQNLTELQIENNSQKNSNLLLNSENNPEKKNLINKNTSQLTNAKAEDLLLLDSDKKNLILCETFKLVEAEQTKTLFPAEIFERVAAIINSKFYKILEKSLEKIPNQNISKKLKVKLLKIITCFYPSNNKIDYMELRKLVSEGLPEELPELRSILWKLFLNFYPNNLNEWHSFSQEKFQDYERIKADLLNGEEQEKYKTLIYEITADITRTRTDMNFFNININFSSSAGKIVNVNSHKANKNLTTNNNNSNINNISNTNSNDAENKTNENNQNEVKENNIYNNNKSESENEIKANSLSTNNKPSENISLNDNNKTKENLGDMLSRILLIFAILHPDLAYIQGMNEILATIYFCFAKSHEVYLESDLFYCFENFMLEVKDIYLKENDNSSRGIHGIVKLIENLLEYFDPELNNHFKEIGIEINFFALRWILIFFSQEFFMPETLRLWDSLLIETDKFKFITYVSLSVITLKREELLSLGFAEAMFSMQNLKNLEFTIDEVLINVRRLQNELDKMYHLLA